MTATPQGISISKTELAELPVAAFTGTITVVETADDAARALERLAGADTVGVDTETKPTFKKGMTNRVALMQISTDDECYLFRLNKTGFTPEMRAFFESERPVKVGLSLKDDFCVLHRVGPFEPKGFVELQSMAHDYDIADLSLQKIYAIVFGGRITKGQRLSNWEAPVLTHSQCVYAATDAWACLRIYNALRDGLYTPPPVTDAADGTDAAANDTAQA